jgi:hypothetical protein
MANYRVLSIDGGGIRGLVTTILLQRLIAIPGLESLLDSIHGRLTRSGNCKSSGSGTDKGRLR